MMSSEPTYKGWLGKDKDSIGNMSYEEFQPRPWSEELVEIQISHVGVCGADVHTLQSGWEASGASTDYPVCVGHEIVGEVVRVGTDVKKDIKLGDIVGVGAQNNSCLRPDCNACSNGLENYCPRGQSTFNSKTEEGHKIYGGYANYHRAPSHFVFKIPDGIPLEMAAPMLCAGITTYTPLADYGCGPGKTVGIVGLGGLGHFGVLWAKALGADKIFVISHSRSKEQDARKMGATDFIATEEADWATKNDSTIDLIVNTASSNSMPLVEYLMLLKVKGTLVLLGAPEEPLPRFHPFSLLNKGTKIAASATGSPKQIEDMLKLATKYKIDAWIEQRPMEEANQVTLDMHEGNARYRYCLVNKMSTNANRERTTRAIGVV